MDETRKDAGTEGPARTPPPPARPESPAPPRPVAAQRPATVAPRPAPAPTPASSPRVAAVPAARPAVAPAPAAPRPAVAVAPRKAAPVDEAAIRRLGETYNAIRKEIQKTIVGQDEVVDLLLVALLANGHCLLEGVPGLAKTLLISSLAQALSLTFKRIQFTPDLMPSDITGTEIIQDDPETGERKFKFLGGPIFANIILADEINRTPPKTQAALLEAMQEKQVSIGGTIHRLAKPFFVLATQNPLEQEGTYPLPEAQQDRFIFKVFVDYPKETEEDQIMRRVADLAFGEIRPVLDGNGILEAQGICRQIPVADAVYAYARRLVRATRQNTPEALEFCRNWLAWGAGPRASIFLITAARARAGILGRTCVTCDDVATVAPPILRHRLACNYVARAEGINADKVIGELLKAVPKY
jgi:MoxR-like ATPase